MLHVFMHTNFILRFMIKAKRRMYGIGNKSNSLVEAQQLPEQVETASYISALYRSK
jgi:hypothetical protein